MAGRPKTRARLAREATQKGNGGAAALPGHMMGSGLTAPRVPSVQREPTPAGAASFRSDYEKTWGGDKVVEAAAPKELDLDQHAGAFEALLGLSLKQATDIMKMELDPLDKNFPKLLSTQQSIMSSVFSTTARVADQSLRRKNIDKMDEMLRELRGEMAPAEDKGFDVRTLM